MRFRRCRLDDALWRAPQPLPDGRRSRGRLAERVAPAQNAPAGTLAGSMAANTALPGTNLNELAGHAGVRECLQFFTREKQWINEIHLQLCRVPAPTFLEQERAGWFLEQFRSFGCDASIDRAGNVLAALGSPPYVALTAHLDTVLAPRNKEEISVDAEGRLPGPPPAALTAGPDWPLCWPSHGRGRVPSGCPNSLPGCCWWPTSAKRARATCWGCATCAASLPWPNRSRAT